MGLRLPAYAGKPISVSRFSDCGSPSRIECSPPASTFKFKLIAMRALPGPRTRAGRRRSRESRAATVPTPLCCHDRCSLIPPRRQRLRSRPLRLTLLPRGGPQCFEPAVFSCATVPPAIRRNASSVSITPPKACRKIDERGVVLGVVARRVGVGDHDRLEIPHRRVAGGALAAAHWSPCPLPAPCRCRARAAWSPARAPDRRTASGRFFEIMDRPIGGRARATAHARAVPRRTPGGTDRPASPVMM